LDESTWARGMKWSHSGVSEDHQLPADTDIEVG
jgi:hypothetical protein